MTIHAEGPITFFHQDNLCLLVMHKDRGFVPGVREKLQKVVEHLAQGDPALVPGRFTTVVGRQKAGHLGNFFRVSGMLDLVQKGGPLMWLIILCSITALGIFLERLLYLHRASIPVGDLLRGLANVLRNENYAEALQECAGTPGPVARVAHAVILHHEAPRSELREVAQRPGSWRCRGSNSIFPCSRRSPLRPR